MRNLAILLFGILMFGCAGSVPVVDKPPSENLVIKNGDNEEHELLIIDPGFQSWFASYAKPVHYYSESYYEAQNRRYVRSWNELFLATGGSGPFGNYINYDYSEDYGLALNYELFWYFKYIESQYGNRYDFPS